MTSLNETPVLFFTLFLYFACGSSLATQAQGKPKMATQTPAGIAAPAEVQTRLGTLRTNDGFPAAATIEKVYDNLDFQRGVQTVLTTMQGASLVAMRRGLRGLGPDNTTVAQFENLMDSKTLFLTANTTTIYNFMWVNTKEETDSLAHFIGAVWGWAGNPVKDAKYINVVPQKNDGKTPYTLTVKDVPVDRFWSISLYNGKGYFQKNEYNAYSINNVTGKKAADGSITIHFGGGPKSANYLPIMDGWNYLIRLYQPHQVILDGTWKFPAPQPVK